MFMTQPAMTNMKMQMLANQPTNFEDACSPDDVNGLFRSSMNDNVRISKVSTWHAFMSISDCKFSQL